VLNLWNCSRNTASGQNAKEFFDQTFRTLGADFSPRRVLCDSGFYQIDFIQYLENKDHTYIMAVPIYSFFQDRVKQITTWKSIAKGIEVSEFEFMHLDKKWTKPRRYVVLRKQVKQRPNAAGKELFLFNPGETEAYRISLFITNDTELKSEQVWEEYRPHANDENVIKDLKEGYGMDAFNLKNFWATEAVLQMISLIFHNRMTFLNRNVFNVKKPNEQMRTLRYKYLIIPAQLGSTGGNPILLHLYGCVPPIR